MRPCCRCWGLTFGFKEMSVICDDCQYEEYDDSCIHCGKPQTYNLCNCYQELPDDDDDEEVEFRCAYCDKRVIGDFRYCSSRCEKNDE